MTEHTCGSGQTVNEEESMTVVEVGPSRIDEAAMACPDCGGAMTYGPIVEHGTEAETTEYMGLSCTECRTAGVFCPDCKRIHHPDHVCQAREERYQAAATERLGGVVSLPGTRGLVGIDECIDVTDRTATYVDEGGCPDCGGPFNIYLLRNPDFEQLPVRPEWEPFGEECQQFGDGCSYRRF